MRRGYAAARVIQYLASTTGELVMHCVSRVRVSCGIGRKQMETIVFELKQYGVLSETKHGKHRIIKLTKKETNV